MRVGIFGGTFDPPHVGHLILAAEARDQLRLDYLLWVLTPDPPHKRDQVIRPVAQRLALVQAALGTDSGFILSRVEIDRPGPHYTVETVRLVAQAYPGAEVYFIMGGDALFDLPDWHTPVEFVRACHGLGVMRRPGDALDLPALEKIVPGVSARVRFIEAPLLEVSSRQIRQRIASGRHYRYFLPPAVYALVEENGWYRSNGRSQDDEDFAAATAGG